MSENIVSLLREQRDHIVDVCNKALSYASLKKADRTKVVANVEFSKRLVFEGGELSLASTVDSRSIGILVHKNQKKGSAKVNVVSESAAQSAVDDALSIAEFSVSDPYLTMPDKSVAPPAQVLKFLLDKDLANFTIEQLKQIMLETYPKFFFDSRISIERYEISLDVEWHGLFNSLGVFQEVQQATIQWNFAGMGIDGDQVGGLDYDHFFAYTPRDLLAISQKSAREFASKLLKNLNPVKGPTYKGAVVLSPRAVSEILLEFVFYHIGGSQVMDNKSKWADKVGSEVMSKAFSLRDDPYSEMLLSASPFDGDGIPTQRRPVIENGKLMQIYHDCYSAKKCGTVSSGTAGGPYSCFIDAGTQPLAELLKSYEQILLVDRFAGNTDPVDGSFSGVAKGSRLFGQQHGSNSDGTPVIETMISGNFFEVAQKILALSAEREVVGGSLYSPYIIVDGVTVTGGG